jgi:hypothetical protein
MEELANFIAMVSSKEIAAAITDCPFVPKF